MTTIKEIADIAGVSRGTVDRVLNNRGSVSAKTTEKILEIAKALDYRPNKAGLTLAAQKKRLKLGVILFGETNPFMDKILEGIRYKQEEFSGYNCSIIVQRIPYDMQAQLTAIDELIREEVHGIMLAPYNAPEVAVKINDLHEMQIPVVTVNTDIANSKRIAYVGSNDYLSGMTAGGLMGLMTSGNVHIGIVMGFSQVLCHTERIAGFQKCIQEKYPNMIIDAIVENQDDEVESYQVTQALLRDHPEINALYFAAGGVYGGCKAVLALDRPVKPTIITHDKVETTRNLVLDGTISATICQQPFIQGTKPLDILFDYLTTGQLPEKELNYVAVDIRIAENI